MRKGYMSLACSTFARCLSRGRVLLGIRCSLLLPIYFWWALGAHAKFSSISDRARPQVGVGRAPSNPQEVFSRRNPLLRRGSDLNYEEGGFLWNWPIGLSPVRLFHFYFRKGRVIRVARVANESGGGCMNSACRCCMQFWELTRTRADSCFAFFRGTRRNFWTRRVTSQEKFLFKFNAVTSAMFRIRAAHWYLRP